MSLCEQYFVIWAELQQSNLTPQQVGSLRARLEKKAKETQSRLVTFVSTYVLAHSFNPSSLSTRLVIHLFMHAFLRSVLHSFIHSSIHAFVRSFIPSSIHSFIHSFIQDLSSAWVRYIQSWVAPCSDAVDFACQKSCIDPRAAVCHPQTGAILGRLHSLPAVGATRVHLRTSSCVCGFVPKLHTCMLEACLVTCGT